MRYGSADVGPAARRREHSEQLQPQASERREKGLWTFLTWAFFLSQAIAADESTAVAARMQAEEDAQLNSVGEALSQPPRSAPAFPEPVDTAQAQDSTFRAPPALSPEVRPVQLTPPEPLQFAAAHETGPAHTPAAPHSSPVGSGTILLSDEQPDRSAKVGLDADNPSANPIIDSGHPILPPLVDIVDDVLGDVLNPILDTVGDVVGSVVGAVDSVLDSLVGTVGGILGGTDAAIVPVVNQVVSPALGTAADLLGDMLRTVGPDALADIGLDSAQTVGSLIGSSHGPLQNAIGPIASPVFGGAAHAGDSALNSIPAPGASAADGLLNALGLSTGRSLEFPSSSADQPHYEIMAGGTYTDYGLTVQSGDLAATCPTSSLIVAATDLMAATEADANAQPANPPPLVSGIEDTRGLLDGLGL